jgi:isocitrate lyase
LPDALRALLRPVSAGSEFLELSILDGSSAKAANVVFADLQDRHGNKVLSIRDQNTFDLSLRRKRLMTLAHLFLIHRYKAGSVHYLSPTEDNRHQTERMKALSIFGSVNTEGGFIIAATVQGHRIGELLNPDCIALRHLIAKGSA